MWIKVFDYVFNTYVHFINELRAYMFEERLDAVVIAWKLLEDVASIKFFARSEEQYISIRILGYFSLSYECISSEACYVHEFNALLAFN